MTGLSRLNGATALLVAGYAVYLVRYLKHGKDER